MENNNTNNTNTGSDIDPVGQEISDNQIKEKQKTLAKIPISKIRSSLENNTVGMDLVLGTNPDPFDGEKLKEKSIDTSKYIAGIDPATEEIKSQEKSNPNKGLKKLLSDNEFTDKFKPWTENRLKSFLKRR